MKDYSRTDLYLSDLHLGSPLIKNKNILRIILQHNYRSVTLIGDTLDVWEDDLDDILKKEEPIIDRLRTIKNLKILEGNHDPSIAILAKVFPTAYVCNNDSFVLDDRKIKLIHGDEFDYMMKKYSEVVRVIFCLYWLSERLFKIDIRYKFKKIMSVAAKRNISYYNILTRDIRAEAIKKYSDHDCVVMGHTHDPGRFTDEKTKTRYINVGDWINNHSYVEYEKNLGFQLFNC